MDNDGATDDRMRAIKLNNIIAHVDDGPAVGVGFDVSQVTDVALFVLRAPVRHVRRVVVIFGGRCIRVELRGRDAGVPAVSMPR